MGNTTSATSAPKSRAEGSTVLSWDQTAGTYYTGTHYGDRPGRPFVRIK